MNTSFDKDRALQSVLYIIEAMGGRCDMHKIFKTLYFADRMHISEYGRSITSDRYIAMQFGPVPSKTDDIFKAVRGDSFFSDKADDLKTYFRFVNKYIVEGCVAPDVDYLSESDVECLDKAILLCKNLNFGQLTELSHGLAWQSTSRDREMSVKDILREAGDTEEYVDYIASRLKMESAAI